ncbi:hypothetical protein FOCC_FOCC013184 [Frankliniella occidentalis]|nr:hypothetical protein FOCC_FOCC013184 [Frankliniella occidentalis]
MGMVSPQAEGIGSKANCSDCEQKRTCFKDQLIRLACCLGVDVDVNVDKNINNRSPAVTHNKNNPEHYTSIFHPKSWIYICRCDKVILSGLTNHTLQVSPLLHSLAVCRGVTSVSAYAPVLVRWFWESRETRQDFLHFHRLLGIREWDSLQVLLRLEMYMGEGLQLCCLSLHLGVK